MRVQQKRLLSGLFKIGLLLLITLALVGASTYILLSIYHGNIVGTLAFVGLGAAVSMFLISATVFILGVLHLTKHFDSKLEEYNSLTICPATPSIGALAHSKKQLESERAIMRDQLKEVKAQLAEFRRQNAEMLTGLESLDNPHYIATDTTPHEFICPITQQIMRQPMEVEPGRSYEYLAIKRWYDLGHRQTPVTRQTLIDPATMSINSELRTRVTQHIRNLGAEALRVSEGVLFAGLTP